MLGDDIKALRSATVRDLRKFGMLDGRVFCLIGLWFFLRHKSFYWWMFVPGVPLVVLG